MLLTRRRRTSSRRATESHKRIICAIYVDNDFHSLEISSFLFETPNTQHTKTELQTFCLSVHRGFVTETTYRHYVRNADAIASNDTHSFQWQRTCERRIILKHSFWTEIRSLWAWWSPFVMVIMPFQCTHNGSA